METRDFLLLRAARNFVTSGFSPLVRQVPFTADENSLGSRVNNLVYKIRQRFDTYRVVVHFPNGAENELTFGLVDSFVEHIRLLDSILVEQEWDSELSLYADIVAGMVDEAFPIPFANMSLEQVDAISRIGSASRLCSNLQVALPPHIAFYFQIKIALEILAALPPRKVTTTKNIVREIVFPPESQQAGISILNYFSVVLNEKYPDIDIAVSIKQEGSQVTMTVTHPDGTEEAISKLLTDYGLVVSGKMATNQFITDPIGALALQHKLELAQLEIRQTRDLLSMERSNSGSRIESLETQVNNMYSLLSRELTSRESMQDGFIRILELQASPESSKVREKLDLLEQAVNDRNENMAKLALDDLQSYAPDVFTRLSYFFYQNAFTGVLGGAAYDWLKIIWPVMPK